MEEYIYVASVPLTLVIVALSIIYSWKSLSRLWKEGDPKQATGDLASSGISDVTVKPGEIDENGGAGDRSKQIIQPDSDPYEYCDHIQSEVKKARQRVVTREIRQNLSAEDMEVEREAQRKQLEEIFKLMEQQNDKFGMESMDQVQEQMRLTKCDEA